MNKSVETHMYASQWFLTIFTAKFPLTVTYQIMDMYLCEVCIANINTVCVRYSLSTGHCSCVPSCLGNIEG